MGAIRLIASRDLRDLASALAFRIVAAALALLAAGSAVAAAALPGLVVPLLYFDTVLPFLAFIWAFSGATLMKEKASGQLETLLATPLSARTLWLAKTAAIALPGLAAAAVAAAATALAALAYRGPEGFPVPLQATLSCFLANPLLFTGLCALTVAISFRSSPEGSIIPSFALGFGLMTAIPAGAAMGFIDLGSWAFAAADLAAGVLMWIAVLVLGSGLTKERIVLSSRED